MRHTQVWAVGPYAAVNVHVDGTGWAVGGWGIGGFQGSWTSSVCFWLSLLPPALVFAVLNPSLSDPWCVLVPILGLVCISPLGDPLMKSLFRTLASFPVGFCLFLTELSEFFVPLGSGSSCPPAVFLTLLQWKERCEGSTWPRIPDGPLPKRLRPWPRGALVSSSTNGNGTSPENSEVGVK